MILRKILPFFKSNKNADKVMDEETKDKRIRQLNAEKVMDKETKDKCMWQLNTDMVMDKETKDKYIRQLNYQNRMKIKELEQKEKQAFQMIPARPIPYDINQGDIDNDDGGYLRPHNYITIISATEAASNKAEKSPGNEILNSKGKELLKNKIETTVSAKGISVNIGSLNEIYDGDRGQNDEQNLCKNNSLQSELFNHVSENNKVQERNTFKRWRLEVNAVPSIYAVPSLDEPNLCNDFTPKNELFIHGSKLNKNDQEQNSFQMWRSDPEPHIYDRMAEPGPAIDVSIGQQAELTGTSKEAPININKSGQEQKELSTFSKSISTVPHETRVNISDDLPQLPLNREVIRCKFGVKHIMSGAYLAVKMVIAGICFMVYYSTTSNTDNSSGNTTDTTDVVVDINDIAVSTYNVTTTIYDVPVTTREFSVTTRDVPVTINDAVRTTHDVAVTAYNVVMTYNYVVVTTTDVAMTTNTIAINATYLAVTTNDVECFNSKSNCRFRVEKKKTEHKIEVDELGRASGAGNITLVCELLKCGISANSHNRYSHTPLVRAAEKGHVNVAQLLLEHNASIDKAGWDGWTPLHMASQYGHTEVVKLLLTHNASMDKAGKDGWPPLYMASEYGHTEVVKLLLTYNASMVITGRDGWTPLHMASQYGRTEVVKLLLTYYVSVDQALPRGQYPPIYLASRYGYTDVVKLLLTYNASVDQGLPSWRNPLYFASKEGHTDVVQLLLTYNASVNKSNIHGWTPLHAAVWKDRDAIVELLCNAGANVNAKTVIYISDYRVAAGSTPLHMAVINENMRIVKTLILHKSELLKDKKGLTALDISRQQNLSDITARLEGILNVGGDE